MSVFERGTGKLEITDTEVIERMEERIKALVAENAKLKAEARKRAAESSWEGEVDTASGAYTQWEIENANKW